MANHSSPSGTDGHNKCNYTATYGVPFTYLFTVDSLMLPVYLIMYVLLSGGTELQ